VGDAAFIEDTRRNPGPSYSTPIDWIRYSRQTATDGTWLGHGGYGGQYMLVNLATGTVVVYFSVLENESATGGPALIAPLVTMMADLARQIIASPRSFIRSASCFFARPTRVRSAHHGLLADRSRTCEAAKSMLKAAGSTETTFAVGRGVSRLDVDFFCNGIRLKTNSA